MKKVLALLLSAAMVLSITACGSTPAPGSSASQAPGAGTPAPTGEVFKIGAYFGLTGAQSVYGVEAVNAIKMGVDYINANGGFNGTPAQLISYDTQSSPEEAIKIVNKLISQDKIDASIGSMNSGEVLASAGYLNDAGIYTLGCGTSPTWMLKDWPYVFRAAMNNDFGSPMSVKMAADIGAANCAILYGQDDSSIATYNSLKAAAQEGGLEILTEQSYDTGDTDFSAQVANILRADPDCVLLAIAGDSMPVIIKQLRQYGYNGILFHKECVSSATVAITGEDNASYVAFPTPYVTYTDIEDCDIPVMKEFLQMYLDTYGQLPNTDSSYRGWDSLMVMWEASKIAGSNESDALRDATHTISDLEGLGGTLDYTVGNREGYNTLNSFIYVGGKNYQWNDWLTSGGFDDYKAATGRER